MSKKLKHTPGPWKVYRATNGGVLGVGDADGGGITDYQGVIILRKPSGPGVA